MRNPAASGRDPDAGLDASTASRLAELATARGTLWDLMADLVAGQPAAVDILRTGALSTAWRTALAPFAGEMTRADAALLVLDAYARTSHRRDPNVELAVVRQTHDLVDAAPSTVEQARTLSALCREEADAWAVGDTRGGRERRAAELSVAAELQPDLTTLGHRLCDLDAPRHAPWRAVGVLTLSLLVAETGQHHRGG